MAPGLLTQCLPLRSGSAFWPSWSMRSLEHWHWSNHLQASSFDIQGFNGYCEDCLYPSFIACHLLVGLGSIYNNASANHKVWKQSFWMMHYFSATPKRSVLWWNSKKIIKFRTPRLRRKYKVKKALVKKYRNRRGEKRFQGNENMSKSGMLSFSGCCVQILCALMNGPRSFDPQILQNLRSYPLGFALRYITCWDDLKEVGPKGALRDSFKATMFFRTSWDEIIIVLLSGKATPQRSTYFYNNKYKYIYILVTTT